MRAVTTIRYNVTCRHETRLRARSNHRGTAQVVNWRISMPSYRAPVEDTNFVLNDVLNYQRYNNLPGFADASPDVVEAILSEGAELAEGPLFQLGRASW